MYMHTWSNIYVGASIRYCTPVSRRSHLKGGYSMHVDLCALLKGHKPSTDNIQHMHNHMGSAYKVPLHAHAMHE